MAKKHSGEIRYSRETSYNMGLDYCDTVLFKVKGQRRGKRSLGKPTSEAQAVVNERNARMNLLRLVNANFREGKDLYITLTFDEAHRPDTRADAKRLTDNFIRRMKRAWDKAGFISPFKWLYVIEGADGKRLHVHLLMSGGLSEACIRRLWGMADIVNVKILQASDKGYEALSVYLTKQGRLTGEHRWYASRTMERPGYAELNAGISADDMEELAHAIEDINADRDKGVKTTAERYSPVESRYPGYFLAEAEAVWLEQFREWVIHIKLYRKDSAVGVREAKRRRLEERCLRDLHRSGVM